MGFQSISRLFMDLPQISPNQNKENRVGKIYIIHYSLFRAKKNTALSTSNPIVQCVNIDIDRNKNTSG